MQSTMSRPGIALLVLSLAPAVNAQYTITTVAGGGPVIGSTAAFAAVNFPIAVAASSGKFYYASDQGCQVFRVNSSGAIDLIVGTGVCSFSRRWRPSRQRYAFSTGWDRCGCLRKYLHCRLGK